MSEKANAGRRIVITDHPWEDLSIEREILGGAGYELVAGPVETPTAGFVDTLVGGADPVAILTCWAQVSGKAIRSASNLRVVSRLGVGLDNIDVAAASARGTWVTNVPDYCVQEVADHAVALALAALRGVVQFDREAKRGAWAPETAHFDRISELAVGIVGYGRIGRAAAARLRPFGCRILAHSRSLSSAEEGVEVADLAAIRELCDVIILNAPLTAETHHVINEQFLAGCARRPLIVNVSRGGLIDNAALLRALAEDRIRGAALDVIEGEPSPPAEIMGHERVIVTPHIAFLSDASLEELRRRACADVLRVLQDEAPLHPCNEPSRAASAVS